MKAERETEDDLEKDRRERVEHGRADELECGQSGGTEQGGLVRQRDSLLCLLVRERNLKPTAVSVSILLTTYLIVYIIQDITFHQ